MLNALNYVSHIISPATELLKGFIDDGVAAISDLFGHYVEAWKSWYVEVAGKKQTNSR